MSEQTEKRNFKPTLNLPKTAFPMKANLVQNEPASLKRWDKIKLYDKLREREHPKGAYVFHDGPPYANGDIHLGHLLNKCLKDFVVRSRSMMGYDCPYTPGWDCHGLPIEHKVMQEMQSNASDMEPIKIRRKCKTYAEKYVKLQKQQMQRLLTMADYDDPYLTMLPKYESAVLEVFAGMIDQGLVYRDLKPVHWSISNQTALAEAELEYYDRKDTSVFVKFQVTDESKDRLWKHLGVMQNDVPELSIQLMIWTTTPWTLPANLAVAVNESANYGLFLVEHNGQQNLILLAQKLAESVFAKEGISEARLVGGCLGREIELARITYHHPFASDDRVRGVYTALYVTLEDGTGMVHTAPGHGVEDYQTGLREGLDIYCPVLPDGTFDETAPDWLQGKSVWEGNKLVCDKLVESGHMFHQHEFDHSYPHDWRSKQPVIFRATEQWFVGVDKDMADHDGTLRSLGLDAAESKIRFIPNWGQNRFRGMIESRPDWCISRQRSWGLPIPAFFKEDGSPVLNADSVRAVAKAISEHKDGSDIWFFMSPEQLLEHYDEPSLDKSTLRKGGDTFDVWFESGSSWNAVLREGWLDKQAQPSHPADLYLEGSDQHRGWFQHSLLPSLAVTGQSPFKTVLTHGFMVDRDGKKMSKSGGNALKIEDLFKDYGADVCRWWVASLNPDNDIKVDLEFFKLAGESYRKVRNTLRFMLSNLNDFDLKANEPEKSEIGNIDRWALLQLMYLVTECNKAYSDYDFRKVHELLFDFCNSTLSAIYLFAIKDRLYCDRSNSKRRRSSQRVLFQITDELTQLMAPLLPHTADEASRILYGDNHCVHLAIMPDGYYSEDYAAPKPDSGSWDQFLSFVPLIRKKIEDFRQVHGIDNPLDIGVTSIYGEGMDSTDAADLLGVSRYAYKENSDVTLIDLRDQPRCERSWKRDETVQVWNQAGHEYDGAMLTQRDAEAVGLV